MALRDLPGCGGHLRKLGGQGAAGHLPALVGSVRMPSLPEQRWAGEFPRVMRPWARQKPPNPALNRRFLAPPTMPDQAQLGNVLRRFASQAGRFSTDARPGVLGNRKECLNRSEERRVGKECRSRWTADTEKKRKE